MKKKIFTIFALAFLMLNVVQVKAQSDATEFIRGEGMIFVVIGVLLIIFAGILVYLFFLDRRLTKLEKNLNK